MSKPTDAPPERDAHSLISDPFDRATELEMLERESVIALARSRFAFAEAQRARLIALHACLNCDAHIDAGLFCDADCRDDHTRRTKAEQRNGTHPQEIFDDEA